ncbi:unnamed protein product [Linum trigynum]|uniref:Uncharacterized protein n=1 Tax=Linum trigynum TaxID=586398 RepID=A0AAV2C8V1_9ROSI
MKFGLSRSGYELVGFGSIGFGLIEFGFNRVASQSACGLVGLRINQVVGRADYGLLTFSQFGLRIGLIERVNRVGFYFDTYILKAKDHGFALRLLCNDD